MTFEKELVSLIPHLKSVARRFSSCDATREDLVQDALERAFRYRDRFLPGTNMKAWASFILANGARSGFRRSWRTVEMPEGMAESQPIAASQHLKMELDELMEAITYLPPEQAEALISVGLVGGAYEEAAETIGVPVGTVKSRVSRARKALEIYFGKARA